MKDKFSIHIVNFLEYFRIKTSIQLFVNYHRKEGHMNFKQLFVFLITCYRCTIASMVQRHFIPHGIKRNKISNLEINIIAESWQLVLISHLCKSNLRLDMGLHWALLILLHILF